jgi:hypothetical protein
MKNELVGQHYQKMKEDKCNYENMLLRRAGLAFGDNNYIDAGIGTDVSYKNGALINSRLEKGDNESEDGNERDRNVLNLDYLYGPKAFEAITKLKEEQIKEFLPLTTLEIDQEKDPEWVKDYKLFLRHNEINLKKHMKPRTDKYDLTKDLQDTKQKKWLDRQKYKLVSQLRKHNITKTGMKFKNNSAINSNIVTNNREERSKSSIDHYNPNLSVSKFKSKNKIDEGVGTGPDILSLLSEMKHDKVNDHNKSNETIMHEFSNAYKTNNSRNIKEEDELQSSKISLSRKSAKTESYKGKANKSSHSRYVLRIQSNLFLQNTNLFILSRLLY